MKCGDDVNGRSWERQRGGCHGSTTVLDSACYGVGLPPSAGPKEVLKSRGTHLDAMVAT